jgi:thiol-disulfide isomerase/thioredoxin
MEQDANDLEDHGRRWPQLVSKKSLLIGLGIIISVVAIAVVSALTGAKVTDEKNVPEMVGHRMKNFSVSGLNGGEIKAPWESGHASVIVFFASWCPPCQGEIPKIANYIRTHSPSPVEVLGMDANDKLPSARAMVKKDNVTFPVAFDPNGAVTSGIFGFVNVPESVFLNAKGVVTGVHYGAIPERQLAAAIEELIKT